MLCAPLGVRTALCVQVCARTPVCVQDADKRWFAPVLPFRSRAAVPVCGHIRAAPVKSGGGAVGEPTHGLALGAPLPTH